MKNARITASVDQETAKALDTYAAENGMKTGNTLLAAVSIELVKASKKGLNLWHVLGRIAADDEHGPAIAENRKALRSAPLEVAGR